MSANEYVRRRTHGPLRDWRAVLGYADLTPVERNAVQQRVKTGLRSTDATVRAVAGRVIEDVVVAQMDTVDTPRHIALELAAFHERGKSLAKREAVPGCLCWQCTGVMPAPRHAPDDSGIVCPQCDSYRDPARYGDEAWYQCADCGTRSALTWRRDQLGEMWDTLPRTLAPAVQPRHDTRPPLNVEAARAVPIRQLAASLGIKANRAGWAVCPFHADDKPSLHLNERKAAAFCNVCAKSWDSIALVMDMERIAFADAVRRLAA